ncbi:MAG: hypothetical protein WD053_02015 [Gracilimonas sp.]
MKTQAKFFTTLLFAFIVGAFATTLQAQERNNIQYYTPPSKAALNVFESPFTTDVEFDGFQVRIGGANTLQFQGISQENDANSFREMENNFNLATSNLDLDVTLAPGMRMHLRTYLSSQHHPEAYVKGGYLQIDSFDFIEEGFLSGLSDNLRIKIGHMENNYGDNHFRRSDNGATITNPFVGNYLMDSFTTEVGGEVYLYSGDIFAMVGLTNGKLNQSTYKSYASYSENDVVLNQVHIPSSPSFLAKLGYDSQRNEDLRIRLTGSLYHSPESPAMYLYSGDRAGSRYYNVTDSGFRSGRINPGFGNQVTAIMINPFVKFQGLEFYGVFENASGYSIFLPNATDSDYSTTDKRTYTQLGAELLYRFGDNEDFYVGTRYNTVSGEEASGNDIDVTRLNLGGGWFMTENVLTKLEYVTQSYDGFTGKFAGAEFSGIMLEAVISF